MELIHDENKTIFNPNAIRPGCLIRAKHIAWPDYRNGLVTAVNEKCMTIFYRPEIGNVTRYFMVYADDAASGGWDITWTDDFTDIWTHAAEPEVLP